MATTRAAAGLTPTQWMSEWLKEHLGNNPFIGETGKSYNNVIVRNVELGKARGDSIVFPLVNNLENEPNDGTTRLVGNEEQLKSRSFKLFVDLRRNAFVTQTMDVQRSAIDLLEAGRAELTNWTTRTDVKRIVRALHAYNGVNDYTINAAGAKVPLASAAQKNTWLANNSDRVLFGAAKGNNTGTFSTSLANVDAVADKLTASKLELMKRIALSANPKLTPVMIEGDNRRWFKVYAHPLCFRDLKRDPDIVSAQKTVSLTPENNRLFKGGDLVWDGMIISEVDDYVEATYSGSGAAGIDVGAVHLCGASALGLGIAKNWERTELKEDDHQNEEGFGYRDISGLEKLRFGTGANDTDVPRDNGVVSGFFAAVADA